MTSHVPKNSHKPIEEMVKNPKVGPLAKVSTSTTSMKNQSEPYYETLETYQGLPCPYGGYYGFYYPGLDGSVKEANENNGYYSYGTEVQYPVMQGENGSLIYLMQGIQSYDHSYIPINPIGHGYYQNLFASSPSYLWNPNGDKYGVSSNTQLLKHNISSSSSHNHNSYYTKNKNSFTGQNNGDRSKSQRKNSFASVPYHDPVKKKSEALDETEEKENGEDHITNEQCESCSSGIRRDQYNLHSFQTKYEEASFFVIKSYSEDDIHKSIKYNVWSSTLNGNKKLNNAYQESQKKSGECPVFLFFSVNASGQFCGVAEMIGSVDYEKSMEFWQQDKWSGYFPVKWHIIKDVPNPQLRHVILENNENKPVTNSRDTQEVRLEQGNEVLKIFKNYVEKTSILDDFDFYENREKVMVQKKLRFPSGLKKNQEDLVDNFQTMKI